MSANEKFEQHKRTCPKCIESAPGQWDLCELGQELLRQIPTRDWIKKEEAQTKQKKAASERGAQESLDASLKIAKEGPVFWKELLENLKENTDALPRIGLSGTTSVTAAPERGQQSFRVQEVCQLICVNDQV